ncbi:MAG TPA: SpoIID/LytB domain-containing protein [Blastocatellia bacterium]|nr:SpoIID/LytB domain-containing protein [Blastocatellia bacterium]
MRTLMGSSKFWLKLPACAATAALCLSTLPQPVFANRPRDEQENRPRRVEDQRAEYGDDGPSIRVGLMTDVTNVTLSSSSRLTVRRSAGDDDNAPTVVAGQMRVEVSHGRVRENQPVYRVEVAAVSDPRRAGRITEAIKKEFDEPSSTIYDDESAKHRVLIGRFSTRSEATEMVDRLRHAGYSEARIAAQPTPVPRYSEATPASNQQLGRAAKTRSVDASPAAKVETGSSAGLVAFEATRLITSSENLLVVGTSQPGVEATKAVRTTEDTSLRRGVPPRPIPTVRIANRDYRGEIHLVLNSRGKINVVNVVPLEEYLRGVVPLELSPSSYPEIEALKAQAIAARSYALSTRGRFTREGFDLYDDARSQVYGGLGAEQPLTNRAVEETRGLVAVYPNEDGRLVPIEALYTSNCGGHTENNEAVFLTKPVPYLRGVECRADSEASSDRQLVSATSVDTLIGSDGRSKAREVSLLQATGFILPRPVTLQYMRAAAADAELQSWTARLAGLLGRDRPNRPPARWPRLIEFISTVSSALYGEGHARLLLPASEINYILFGLSPDELPGEARADTALLVKDGVLRLPGDLQLNWQVTREYAIETLARAICLKAKGANPGAEPASSKLAPGIYDSIALSAENNRLLVPAAAPTKIEGRFRSFPSTAPNANATKSEAARTSGREAATLRLELETGAKLFRRLGGESYAADRIPLRGGERVKYHVNSGGRIDFLEAEASAAAPNDMSANTAQWRERLSVDEVKRRLARFRFAVGEVEDLIPVEYGASNRVVEMKIVGSDRSPTLRGQQVRSALGLKESLFVIERERDESDRITAFVFTGRGWGHGVGLCQTGAYALAKVGYSYLRILQKYYTGVRVQKVY